MLVFDRGNEKTGDGGLGNVWSCPVSLDIRLSARPMLFP
ncbi:MAG: hypothetical protein PWP23_2015 [Candidatus Sumerlaeota bacterium]|nr:hypothetical protein [Candidatus Sumerlaeota bacterium]